MPKITNKSLRLATMFNAIQTGTKDARCNMPCDTQQYGARKGSAWAQWYIWGYQAMPFPQELIDAGYAQ